MFDRLLASKKRPRFKAARKWDQLQFDLSGACFSVELPSHDDVFPAPTHGSQVNIFDSSWYCYDETDGKTEYGPSRLGRGIRAVLNRVWRVYGGLWTGQHIGSLGFAASVVDTSRLDPRLDCFQKEQFEQLVLYDLYYHSGPGWASNQHTAPVNWRIREIEGIEWIYLESWSKSPEWEASSPRKESQFSVYLYTPLSKDKFLSVAFSCIGSLPAKPSNDLMFARIEQVVASLSLKLSAESLKLKTETEHRHPGSSYSTSRDPEPWKYYTSFREGDFLAGEPPVVTEGPSSPPPALY